jgi:hypothetical protein
MVLPISHAQMLPTMRSGLCGAGLPSDLVGDDGDLFNCTDSFKLYGPKTNGSWGTAYSVILGQGCTTATHIDKDCDGYGVGATLAETQVPDPNPLLGPDADDLDAAVNTPASMLAAYGTVSAFLTYRGYATNRIYYMATDGSNSNFTTFACDVTHPCLSYSAVSSILQDGAGGTVIYRAGTHTTTALVSGTPYASSPLSPVTIMAYPGERVVSRPTSENVAFATGSSGKWSQNLVVDGFTLTRNQYRGGSAGQCVTGDRAINLTIRNIEAGGCYHGWQVGGGGVNIVLEDSYWYDTLSHAVYPTSNSLGSRGGTFDGSGWVFQPLTYNPFYNIIIRRNIFSNAGNQGLEAVHMNAPIVGFAIYNNIVYASGGVGLGFQMGPQQGRIYNNLVFANSSAAIQANHYGCENGGLYAEASMLATVCNYAWAAGTAYPMSNMVDFRIVNNTFWQGSLPPPTNPAPKEPTGILEVKDTSDGWDENRTPNTRFLKDFTFDNNLAVTYSPGGSKKWRHFDFGQHSYPDTYYIRNNGLWNGYAGNSDALVAWFFSDVEGCVGSGAASCKGLLPARTSKTTLVADGSTLDFAGFQAYNTSKNSGNVWGNPLLKDAPYTYQTTPAKYNFHLQAGSPAIGAGLASVAPAFDLRMNARSLTAPSIGAIEYGAAPFVGTWYRLTTLISGAGRGAVTSPNGTSCMTDRYLTGTSVTCVAIPVNGSAFTGWTGTGSASACSGTGNCTFTMSADSTLTAGFATGGGTGFVNVIWCAPTTIPVGGVARCFHQMRSTVSSNAAWDYTNNAPWLSSDPGIATVYKPYDAKGSPGYAVGQSAGVATITHNASGAQFRGTTTITVVPAGYMQTLGTGANPVAVAGSVCGGLLAAGTPYSCIVAAGGQAGGSLESVTDTCGSTITPLGPKSEIHSGTMPNSPCSIIAHSTGTTNAGRTVTWTLTGRGQIVGAYCHPGVGVYPIGTPFSCLAVPTPGETVTSIVAGVGTVASAAGPQLGTPKTGPEVYGVVAAATNTVNFSATGVPAPPTIEMTSPLDGGQVGALYGVSLVGAQGVPPYSWSVVAGSLCAGLSLNSGAAVITGTPTTAQTCTFTVLLTDSALETASRELEIRIEAAPSTTPGGVALKSGAAAGAMK